MVGPRCILTVYCMVSGCCVGDYRGGFNGMKHNSFNRFCSFNFGTLQSLAHLEQMQWQKGYEIIKCLLENREYHYRNCSV